MRYDTALMILSEMGVKPPKAQNDSSQGTASRNTKLVVNSKRFEFRTACTKKRERESALPRCAQPGTFLKKFWTREKTIKRR